MSKTQNLGWKAEIRFSEGKVEMFLHYHWVMGYK